MFKRIAAAKELLDPENKAEEWVRYKKDALNKTPAEYRIDQLEGLLKVANNKFSVSRGNFFDYLMAVAGCSDVVTVANIGRRELYVHDQTLLINNQTEADDKFRVHSKKPNKYYFRWVIKEDGAIFYDKGFGPQLQSGKRLVGSISKNSVYKLSSTGDIFDVLSVARRIWTSGDETSRDSTIVERYLPNIRESSAPIDLHDGTLSVEQFMKIIHLITPVIDEEYFIFAVNIVDGRETFFTLEGRVESMDWNSGVVREEGITEELAEHDVSVDENKIEFTGKKLRRSKPVRKRVDDSGGN